MTTIASLPRPWSGFQSAAKSAIALVVEILCRLVGRRKVVRAAQFALSCARLDVGFDIRTDGEVELQGWALDVVPEGRRVHVVDVGANIGQWSQSLLETAEHRGRIDEIDLHAFEPTADTFEKLVKALDHPAVSLQRAAVSDQPGTATLHVDRKWGRWNSFHEIAGLHSTRENVVKTTLDIYARDAGLDRIDLLKIDTEGHDLAVLTGACGLLRHERIGVVQFEYNRCWIYARQFLRDAFELLTPLGYRLGKLTPRGVVFSSSWYQGLETFAQAQYVACTKDIAKRLPRVDGGQPAGRELLL